MHGAHVFDRPRAQYANAVEAASAREHHRELCVILGRCHQTAGAREIPFTRHPVRVLLRHEPALLPHVRRYETLALRGIGPEERLLHAERPEDSFAEKCVEIPARRDLYDAAQYAEAGEGAVIPARAGLELERRAAELIRPREPDLVPVRRHRPADGVAHGAAHDARRVRHEVEHSDLTLGRNRIEIRLVRLVRVYGPANRDHLILVARQKPRDGIGKAQLAFLDEHHDCDPGHGLRHRSNTEYRVGIHGRAGFGVHGALGLQMRDPAVARYERNGARDVTGFHVTLNELVDTLETSRRQTNALRLHCLRMRCLSERPGHGQRSQDCCYGSDASHSTPLAILPSVIRA